MIGTAGSAEKARIAREAGCAHTIVYTEEDFAARVMEITGDDPLPYGIEPNRAMIDQLVSHATRQGIIGERPDVRTLFAAGTHDLVA